MEAGIQEILLVEDNPGDVRLVEEALETTTSTLHVASDGQEALDFLHQNQDLEERSVPEMVLLDLNLARVSGERVLDEIKSDPDLAQIQVIILTSTRKEHSSVGSDCSDVSAFLTKPSDPAEFMDLVRSAIFE